MSGVQAQILLAPAVADSTDNTNQVSSAVLWGIDGQTVHALGVSADFSATVGSILAITFAKGGTVGTGGTGTIRTAGLVIGSTDTKVASIEFEFAIGGVQYHKAAVAGGTTLSVGTIPADKWGLYKFTIPAGGTIACAGAAANGTTGYATEALAIAAKPATPAGSASLGYVTVLTKAGQPFVAGTDGLEGGASGNVSDDTNYYSEVDAPATALSYKLRWDFSNGPVILNLPGVLRGAPGEGLMASLPASGDGAKSGQVHLFGFYK